MTTFSRRAAGLLAMALLMLPLAPQAAAGPRASDHGGESRARRFAPAPSPRPDASQGERSAGSLSAGPRIQEVADGRFTWEGGVSVSRVIPSTPVETLGFDAIPRIGGNWPADPTGALGESVFMTAVNTSYAIYDRTGLATLGPEPLRPLFPLPSGTQVFDPKVVYDQYEEHFVLTFLAVNDARARSWILVVTVPDASATDISTWCGARIDGDRTPGDGRQFADYPGLGYDRDHVVVTTNQFDFAGQAYRGAQVLSMRKGRLYDCDRTLRVKTFAGNQTRNPDGSLAFTMQPATTSGPGNQLYLLSFQDGRPNFIVLWRLRETLKGLVLQQAALKVKRVGISPYGTQGGGGLGKANTWWDPGDLRLTNAFADLADKRVYGAHVIARDFGPDDVTGGYVEAGIRWYEIRVRPKLARSTLERTGTLGAAETDAGWPAIATDVDGNVFITYSRASQPLGEFLSAWVARIAPGRTAAVTQLLASGSARMEAVPGPERWGDYAGISRDPLDPTLLALVNQYALSDGAGPTRDWQETVHVVGEPSGGA